MKNFFLGKKIFLGGGTNRNSKIGLHYDIRDIPISLHAKFQGNRTIRLGEKREQTDTKKHRNTETQTDRLKFYIYRLLAESTRFTATKI